MSESRRVSAMLTRGKLTTKHMSGRHTHAAVGPNQLYSEIRVPLRP